MTPKCPVDKKTYPPGQHGTRRRFKHPGNRRLWRRPGNANSVVRGPSKGSRAGPILK